MYKYKCTNINVQIEMYKYKCTNINVQIEMYKQKCTNRNAQKDKQCLANLLSINITIDQNEFQ